jgi:hypothetical protein
MPKMLVDVPPGAPRVVKDGPLFIALLTNMSTLTTQAECLSVHMYPKNLLSTIALKTFLLNI